MSTVKNVTASDFEAEVLHSTEPVLIDFWAPWCGPCLRQQATLEALRKELGDQVKFVKVNVDTDLELANRCEVRCIPNLVLFKEGRQVDRIIGVTSSESIGRILLSHLVETAQEAA